MRARYFFALAIAALLVAADATAQGMPRRGSGPPADMQDRRERTPRKAPPPVAADPYSALERELPSLNVDLMLTREQRDPWRLFERDVRDIAEMGRAQRRRLMALRNAEEKSPTGTSLITALAEDERAKAAAAADLKHHLEALYETLDEKQKAMLDRRIVQSQTEPLGR